MTKIGNFLVKLDNACDYFPIVSTTTNLVDLFQKTIVLPRFTAEEIESSHYYAHLQKKKISRCLMLLLPLIGNLIVAIQDFRNQPGMKSYLANVQKDIQISKKSFEKHAKLVSINTIYQK